MPAFGKVVIVGPGLMGGSLGLALRATRLAQEVVGVARRASTLDAAMSVGAIDFGEPDLTRGVRGADLVVLATPVRAIAPAARLMAPHLSAGCLVTDMGSTKAEVVRDVSRALPDSVDFVGGHPMVGSEESGPRSARADLYRGAAWVLTPAPEVRPDALGRMRALVADLGAHVLEMDPETHDRAAAASSHLPHLVASALAAAVADLGRETRPVSSLCARGFRDTTRVASGPADVWRDICLTNRPALLRALEQYRRRLDAIVRHLEEADGTAIEEALREGAVGRARLLGRQEA